MQMVTQNMVQMSQGMQTLSDQVRVTSFGLEQMRIENHYRQLIGNLDDELKFYREKIRYATDDTTRTQAAAELDKLENQKRQLLDERQAATAALTGQTLIPPPLN